MRGMVMEGWGTLAAWALVATISVETVTYAWPLRLGWLRGVVLFLSTNLAALLAGLLGGFVAWALVVPLGEWAGVLAPCMWCLGVVAARVAVYMAWTRSWEASGPPFYVGLSATVLSGIAISLCVLTQIVLMIEGVD